MVLELMGGAEDPILEDAGSRLWLGGVLPFSTAIDSDPPHLYLKQSVDARESWVPKELRHHSMSDGPREDLDPDFRRKQISIDSKIGRYFVLL